MCSRDVLDHNITVDEVGSDPSGVEYGTWLLQEHHTHHVVANVPLFVYLLSPRRWRGGGGGGDEKDVREGEGVGG